ncbi:unnamed protein product [Effrenium voratum]|nr:unnamed protein product [Effrenium voratum]
MGHVYQGGAANRTQIDWNLTLRQGRREKKKAKSASAPNLHTAELAENRTKREPLAPEHPDGPYHGETPTVGRYQNFANVAHMCNGLARVSSGAAHSADWQLNLRGGLHRNEFSGKWRRHHAKSHQSFDCLADNCNKSNEKYQGSQVTPEDRKYDRRYGALSIETIRDDPISFRRWPGCEGTQAQSWCQGRAASSPKGKSLARSGSFRPSQKKNNIIAKIQAVVDPQNRHGMQRVLAAMTWLGLTPEDLDGSKDQNVEVSSKVPDPKQAQKIKEERVEVWEGLRKARLIEVERRLQFMSDDDARRVMRAKPGQGVRMVTEEDLPPVEALDGMQAFEEMRQKAFQKIQEEQQRKAALLASGFLMEKKRLDEADRKIAALEQRLKEYKKAQADAIEAQKKENAKAQEKRQAQVQKTARDRAKWEDETYEDLMSRIDKARSTRAKMYSKEGLKDTLELGVQRRQKCFDQALEREQALLASIEAASQTAEERLQVRRQEIEEECRQKAEQSQAKFQERQVRIYAQTQDWVDRKLEDHAKFKAHYKTCIKAGQDLQKARSKSAGEITKKAMEKWRANHTKIEASREKNNSDLLERQEQARQRTEERMALKLKCANDIHSYKEVKYKTWGELQRRRMQEIQQSRDAQTQALVIKIAEGQAKARAQDAGQMELKNQRARIGADTLALNDRAKEGFLKIKAEPDERRIIKVMSDLGFRMPKLPDQEDEEDEKKAF